MENTDEMQKTFDTIKFVVMQKISGEMIRAQVDIERFVDDFAIRATGRFLGQSSIKHYEVKYPSDWWQAFKERWFFKWLLEKYPVRYTETIIDIDAIYPELHKKLQMPNEEHFYNISHYTTEE